MFALLVAGHLLANYNAVKSVVMETFNRNRFHIMTESYLRSGHLRTPLSVNSDEPVLTGVSRHFVDIRLGCSIRRVLASQLDPTRLARLTQDKYTIELR